MFWMRGSIAFFSFIFLRNLFRTIIELLLTVLRNRGKRCLQFRKPGANTQNYKNKGKRAIAAQNQSSYAIVPVSKYRYINFAMHLDKYYI